MYEGTPEWLEIQPRCPPLCLLNHEACPPFCITSNADSGFYTDMGGATSKPETKNEQINSNARLNLTEVSVHGPTTMYTILIIALVVAVGTLIWIGLRRQGWCSGTRTQNMRNNYRRRLSEIASMRPMDVMRMRDQLALEMVMNHNNNRVHPTAVLTPATSSTENETHPYSPQY